MFKRDHSRVFFIRKSSEECYSVIKHFRDYSHNAVMGNSLSAGGIQFLFALSFFYQTSGKTDTTHEEAVKQKYTPKSMVKKKASDTLEVLILPCKKLEEEEKTAALLCTKAPYLR